MKNIFVILFVVALVACHKDSPAPTPPPPTTTNPTHASFTDTFLVNISYWTYSPKYAPNHIPATYSGVFVIPTNQYASSETIEKIYIAWTPSQTLSLHNWRSAGDSLYCGYMQSTNPVPFNNGAGGGDIGITYAEGADSISFFNTTLFFQVVVFNK